MTDCEYCSETFSDEDSYLEHLASVHRAELGRIDQKRVEQQVGRDGDDEGDGPSQLVLYGIGVTFLLIIVGTVALVLSMGGGEEGDIHEHGDITLEIDGEVYDFDQQQYYLAPEPFHFHQGQGNYWHMHPERVTLGEAMDIVDKPITETSIIVDGETYDDEDDDTDVTIAVDGEEVSPDHELEDGDHIQITVDTGE